MSCVMSNELGMILAERIKHGGWWTWYVSTVTFIFKSTASVIFIRKLSFSDLRLNKTITPYSSVSSSFIQLYIYSFLMFLYVNVLGSKVRFTFKDMNNVYMCGSFRSSDHISSPYRSDLTQKAAVWFWASGSSPSWSSSWPKVRRRFGLFLFFFKILFSAIFGFGKEFALLRFNYQYKEPSHVLGMEDYEFNVLNCVIYWLKRARLLRSLRDLHR